MPARGLASIACALLALSCAPSDPVADAATDARVPTPQRVSVGDERATLIVETDPLRFRVERADGSVALSSVTIALRLGTTPRGDERFHDPNHSFATLNRPSTPRIAIDCPRSPPTSRT